uniref:Uncharacterized protein n=1 Tax=Setaria italica TaxID=4555 RepID=K4ANF0_SETIT
MKIVFLDYSILLLVAQSLIVITVIILYFGEAM